MTTRHYQWFDHIIIRAQKSLDTLRYIQKPDRTVHRASPSETCIQTPLSNEDKKHSGRLMRINHTGEICAQALYLGQSLTTRSAALRESFSQAAEEEGDHLYWCQQRLSELNSHTSYLNPLWFAGSLFVGMGAGWLGDRWNLGFLAETEHQVTEHLGVHLTKLPLQDHKSRAILIQMQMDEAKHATTARLHGAATLPYPIQTTMRWLAKVMTSITYFI